MAPKTVVIENPITNSPFEQRQLRFHVGEPDMTTDRSAEGRWAITLRGVIVCKPTAGVIRSWSTDDVLYWFLDTEYDGENVFVRHVYFTAAAEPYEPLRRALHAEIDEAAWVALHPTMSMPFDPPVTGEIAIKVTDHLGEGVPKVSAGHDSLQRRRA